MQTVDMQQLGAIYNNEKDVNKKIFKL